MKKTSGFIERTLLDIVSLLKASVSSEETASRRGFLQACDPRYKTAGVFILILAVLLAGDRRILAVIYCISLILAVCSSLGLWYFLKRTLWFIPLFAGFIAIPAVFNVVTPGEPLVSFTVFSHSISITRQGIDSASIFLLRVLASVSLAVLLMLTTRHHVLLKVLRMFGVPRLFVMVTGMCYRYIFLFLDMVQHTFVAIKSRVGYIESTRAGRQVAGANMAALWLKSYRLQAEVYNAMVSRGYAGEPQVAVEFRGRVIDIMFLVTSLGALIGTVWLNHFSR